MIMSLKRQWTRLDATELITPGSEGHAASLDISGDGSITSPYITLSKKNQDMKSTHVYNRPLREQ